MLILIFAIFPTFYSIVFALSRVRFTADGLQFRFVGFQNFAKQLFGTDQDHFLGKIAPISLDRLGLLAVVAAAVLWWLFRSAKKTTWVGMIGRSISAFMAIFLAWVLGVSLLSGNSIGTLTHDAVLRLRRLRRAIRHRSRTRVPVLAADRRQGAFSGSCSSFR